MEKGKTQSAGAGSWLSLAKSNPVHGHSSAYMPYSGWSIVKVRHGNDNGNAFPCWSIYKEEKAGMVVT